jgi:hypothetical protein
MTEISVILKNNTCVSIEEFRILDRYACSGKLWTLINRNHYVVRQRTIEYIFDPETLFLFRLISQNILATWNTDYTRILGPNDEFYLGNDLYIRHLENRIIDI